MLKLGCCKLAAARIATRLSLIVGVDDFGGFEELAVLVLLEGCQELIAMVDRAIESEGAFLEVLCLHAQ